MYPLLGRTSWARMGLKVVERLHDEGMRTNMTATMAFEHLYLTAKAGASCMNLFFNRMRDAGLDPVMTIHRSAGAGAHRGVEAHSGNHQEA